jgi:SAM-dependent methyltransferase
MDERLLSDRFPRASRYHPEWLLAGFSGGANPLWLTEWLAEALDLQPGMKVLDLGCGRGLSSIFLGREFGLQVWAADLWTSPSENLQRIRDAGVLANVFPIRVEARSLPFAEEFFDAIVSIDSFMYYGTDDLYLNSLARYVKPGGPVGIAQAGLVNEIEGDVPPHLAEWWAAERPYCLHSAEWWRRHWERTGLVDLEVADTLPGGWKFWRDWQALVSPGNEQEIRALEADAGRSLGYIRCVCRRRTDAQLFDPHMSLPMNYTPAPLWRDAEFP